MKKVVLVLGILFIYAATAQAGFNFGVKALSLSESFDSWEYLNTRQMLGCYMGVDVSPQIVIIGGVDFFHQRMKEQDSPGYYNSIDTWEWSVTSFTPNLGIKFYFTPRTSGDISAYLQGLFFKSFASVKDVTPYDSPEWIDFDEELMKEILSPFGFVPAFGVEYFFSDNFSLGGEAGLRITMSKAEASIDVGDGETYKVELNNDYFSKYIGITLNYRFGAK